MKTSDVFRRMAIQFLRRVNPGDIAIRHHYTHDKLMLHSFRHKGYWYYGKKREQKTMDLFAELIQPGDSVVELGGHIGFISLYFASLVGPHGQVVVFEPGINNLPYIRRNVALHPQITLVEKAASNYIGTARFHMEDLTGQNNSLLNDYEVFDRNVESAGIMTVETTVAEVQCVTLDSYLQEIPLPRLSLIKIDVEGAELLVLGGMENTLQQDNVALMIEVTRAPEKVFELMKGLGFQMFLETREPIMSPAQIDGNLFCIKAHDRRISQFMS